MNEITIKGVTTTVEGDLPKLGTPAPEFKLTDRDNKIVSSEDFKNNTVLISVYPDINTRVCDLQTRHFFKVSQELEDVVILNVSNNTPEEMNEWCAAAGLDVQMLSDNDHSFANAYGLWIPEKERLARSIFVIDPSGDLVYQELVGELSSEPNYDAALAAIETIKNTL